MKRRKMAAILGIALLLVLPACSKKNPKVAGDSSQARSVDLANATPDFRLKASDYHKEFKTDANAAKAKYMNKIIELEGEVSMLADSPQMCFVHLSVEKDLLGVRCGCPVDAWKSVIPKAKVTVRGQYTEKSIFDGELYPCVVIKNDSKIETLNAEEIAKEVLADAEKAAEKYKNRWVWIESTIIRKGKKDGVLELVLKGSGNLNISCGVPDDAKNKLSQLNPGQTVKVFGELNVYSFDKSISLDQIRFE